MSEGGKIRFAVEGDGRRTLTVLVKERLDLSNKKARALIEGGAVRVDGKRVDDPVLRPRPGAEVVVTEAERGARRRREIAGPGFKVLFVDANLVVAEKESGVVVIPTGEDDPEDPPLVTRVGAALRLAGYGVAELWVVHRIDRATSGLVLFARSEGASTLLREQFRQRSPRREYLAWTRGLPDPSEGRLVHRLEEDPQTHRVEVTERDSGREAILDYTVEKQREADAPAARVRVSLVTGRRNQIRAQFAHVGVPLIGDLWYGEKDPHLPRAALHAQRLEFAHPYTRKTLSFEAALPRDLEKLDRRLFGYVPKR